MPILQIGQIIQRSHGIRGGATGRSQKLGRDHCHCPVHTNHACSVIALSSNCPGHMSSVSIRNAVVNSIVVVDEIPAIDVIDVSVAVIVDTIRYLVRIHPDIFIQIRMRNLYAFIDNPNDNTARSCEVVIPRLFRIGSPGICRSSRAR